MNSNHSHNISKADAFFFYLIGYNSFRTLTYLLFLRKRGRPEKRDFFPQIYGVNQNENGVIKQFNGAIMFLALPIV